MPDDLARIRAYVRWEESGKPSNTSPAWQQARARPAQRASVLALSASALNQKSVLADSLAQAEFEKAREDLRRELQAGATLNDIRRRYKLPVSDEQPPAPASSWSAPARPEPGAPHSQLSPPGQRVQRREWDLRALLPQAPPAAPGPRAVEKPPTALQSLAAAPPPELARPQQLATLAFGAGQLLVQCLAAPAGCTVLLTSDAELPLTLHWGVSHDDPAQWLPPPKPLWPPGSAAAGALAAETPLVRGASGLQSLALLLSGEAQGVQFVLRCAETGAWFKNGDQNWRASFVVPREAEEVVGRAAHVAAARALGPIAAQICDVGASSQRCRLSA